MTDSENTCSASSVSCADDFRVVKRVRRNHAALNHAGSRQFTEVGFSAIKMAHHLFDWLCQPRFAGIGGRL